MGVRESARYYDLHLALVEEREREWESENDPENHRREPAHAPSSELRGRGGRGASKRERADRDGGLQMQKRNEKEGIPFQESHGPRRSVFARRSTF